MKHLQFSSDMQHIASIVECVMETAYLAVFCYYARYDRLLEVSMIPVSG